MITNVLPPLASVYSLSHLFEFQVHNSPEKTALVIDNQSFTYRQLNQKANQLARVLRQQHQQHYGRAITPDTLIALYLDRSVEMVISILAVLKAGAAYLPISPKFPEGRCQYIVEDSQAAMLLTHNHYGEQLSQWLHQGPKSLSRATMLLAIEHLHLDGENIDDLPVYSGVDDLAYVIYTSGTTGKPKGVMMEHGGGINMVYSTEKAFGFSQCKSSLLLTDYVFDVSVMDFFASFCNGLTAYLTTETERLDVRQIENLFYHYKIEQVSGTPSVFNLLDLTKLGSVKMMVVGGEVPNQSMFEQLSQHCRVFNTYGPTESCVCTTSKLFQPGVLINNIGVAHDKYRTYVLDEYLQPVADGEVGQLYVSGVSLARGYLNQPQLNAERFINNPFADDKDKQAGFARLYQTGDLVKFATVKHNGSHEQQPELLYQGRNDFQVKIRGFRVELGEIEAVLTQLPQIKQAVVITCEHGGQNALVAYILAESCSDVANSFDIDSVKSQAAEKLADYMLPSSFNLVAEFPLTINGKIDRRALPEPVWIDGSSYVAPQNQTQGQICEVVEQLLNIDQVGIEDDFFNLGVNSLVATSLSVKLSDALGKRIDVADIMSYSTAAQLSEYLAANGELCAGELIFYQSDERPEFIPLTHQNQQIWFLTQLNSDIRAYNCHFKLRIRGPLDVARMEQTLSLFLQRHEIYRTIFVEQQGQPCQVVEPAWRVKLEPIDLSHLTQSEQDSYIAAYLRKQSDGCFDVSKLPLVTWTLFKRAELSHELVQFEHHFVHDGISFNILLEDYIAIYSALYQGKTAQQALAQLPKAYQYADYALHQQQLIKQPSFIARMEKWAARLAEYPATSMLLSDKPRPKQQSFEGERIDLRLDEQLISRLDHFSQRQGVTLYATMLSAYALLVNRYNHQDKLLIASAAGNRLTKEEQTIIGMIVNTTVLPIDIDNDSNMAQFVQSVHQSVIAGLKAQDIPYPLLVDKVNPERRTDINPLCQLNFSFHDSVNPPLDFADIQCEVDILKNRSAKFDMNVVVIPPARSGQSLSKDNRLQLLWEYNNALYEEQTVNRFIEQYIALLEKLPDCADKPLHSIEVLSAEQQQFLLDISGTKTPAPNAHFAELVAAQAAQTPDNIAVIHSDKQLSYRQLEQRANQLAHLIRQSYLDQHGREMAKDTPVVLYLPRSVETVLAMLAVQKAGGCFVPVATSFPAVRTRFIVEDCQSPLVLTVSDELSAIEQICTGLSSKFLAIDHQSLLQPLPSTPPEVNLSADDRAYIIYTSGTTGNPKGVMLCQRSFCQFIVNFAQQLELQQVNALTLTQYTFDIFGFDYGLSLTTGGRVILSDASHGHDDLAAHLADINYIGQTPSMWQLLLSDQAFDHYQSTQLLNHIVALTIGETGSHELFENLAAHFNRLLNVYGPTETAIGSTLWQYQSGSAVGMERIIGRPFDGEQVYLLSPQQTLVPQGAVGEMYIGGVGLAEGYLNRDDLNHTAFIDSPVNSSFDSSLPQLSGRLYKTGDLARWVEVDGQSQPVLAYLGRNDSQVKIRGFRIELDEINSILLKMPQIKQSAVVDVQQGNDKYLAAYYVEQRISEDEGLTKEAIVAHLTGYLPEYMVPVSFNRLDTLPVNANGKLDRKALPQANFVDTDAYLAAQNEQQQQLCQIWQTVLGVEQVGIADNFFAIGGNSINAVKLITGINRQMELHLTLADLFEHPTVIGLDSVASIASESNGKNFTAPITPLQRERYPLSFAQERILFIEQFERGSDAYHIPYLAELADDTDIDLLQQAYDIVIAHHPILNTVYGHNETQGSYQRVLDGKIDMVFVPVANEALFEAQVRAEVAKPFDLSAEPSLRLRLYQCHDSRYLLTMWHHIAFDGWSTGLFLQQLGQVYQALLNDQPVSLNVADISYGDYAMWQRQHLKGQRLNKLEQYWQSQLSGFESLNLATDKPRPAKPDFVGDDFDFELDIELSNQLRQLAKQRHTTLYTVLLAAFKLTLSALTGQQDIVVGTPSDNRELAQTQDLVGLFVNSLAIRSQIDPQASVNDFIAQLHQQVLQAKLHQEIPFEKLVELLAVERDSSRHPVFQVMFNLLNYNREDDAKKAQLPFSAVELASGEKLYHPAKFDLSANFKAGDGAISASFNYAVSLFERHTIKAMVGLYQLVLTAFVTNNASPVAQLSLVNQQQRQMLLEAAGEGLKLNETDKLSIGELFSAQALKTPDVVALIEGKEFERQKFDTDKRWTYRQLEQQANQMAASIRAQYHAKYQQPMPLGCFVALYQQRSSEMLISMLAVLKAGGAYVPVAANLPDTRKAYMLQDSQAALVITSDDYQQQVQGLVSQFTQQPLVLNYADCQHECQSDQSVNDSNPFAVKTGDLIDSAELPAYVIYTSGTTGQPKGVVTNHLGVTTLARFNQSVSVNTGDVFAHLSSPNFDAATFEIYTPWLNGGTVAVVDAKLELSAQNISDFIAHNQVNGMFVTRALFDHCYRAKADMFAPLNYLLVGGEALNPTIMRELVGRSDRPKHVINGYGPTETTTFASHWLVEDFSGSVPIGRAVAGRQLYVLNRQLQLVPPGGVGELYIGGCGVANGYLNNPQLTEQRFIDSPFGHAKLNQGKLYKTGDLVRWRLDEQGQADVLEYLGRSDRQVKVRGFRVELAEIEQALMQISEVKQAVVIAVEHNLQTQLAAYIVADETEAQGLLNCLATQLPDYMLPSTFTFIDVMPVTTNGKLDMAALPQPTFSQDSDYQAPENQQQRLMCEIWQQELAIDKVGISDNFFQLGGNSIVAVRMAATVKRQLDLDIPLSLLFDQKTIKGVLLAVSEQSFSQQQVVIESQTEALAVDDQVNSMRL